MGYSVDYPLKCWYVGANRQTNVVVHRGKDLFDIGWFGCKFMILPMFQVYIRSWNHVWQPIFVVGIDQCFTLSPISRLWQKQQRLFWFIFGFVYTIRKHFSQFSSNFRLNPNMTMHTVYGGFFFWFCIRWCTPFSDGLNRISWSL